MHLHLENFEEAIADTQKAIELDPNFTKVSVADDILACHQLHN